MDDYMRFALMKLFDGPLKLYLEKNICCFTLLCFDEANCYYSEILLSGRCLKFSLPGKRNVFLFLAKTMT